MIQDLRKKLKPTNLKPTKNNQGNLEIRTLAPSNSLNHDILWMKTPMRENGAVVV